MSNHNWQVGETYKTRGGWEAKVLSTDGPDSHPIIVKHKNDLLQTHYTNGQFWSTRISDNDLIPPKREMFVVYDLDGEWYASNTSLQKAFQLRESCKGKIIRFVEECEVNDE